MPEADAVGAIHVSHVLSGRCILRLAAPSISDDDAGDESSLAVVPAAAVAVAAVVAPAGCSSSADATAGPLGAAAAVAGTAAGGGGGAAGGGEGVYGGGAGRYGGAAGNAGCGMLSDEAWEAARSRHEALSGRSIGHSCNQQGAGGWSCM